ncbi:MAG: AMP-binding protein [Desulfuromonadaceae bacterium]|nr:AMP-binding protein [Desulfuromonas sp.]MDY0212715.1 AMP-binding protein [Desulfuromonadaceae bacterium]
MNTATEQRQLDYACLAEQQTLQLHLLKQHLHYLEQYSPYYRNLFGKIGFNSADFSNLAQLAELPFTTKSELGAHNPDFLAVDPAEVVDICETSGTTGEPVTLWQNEHDLQRLAYNECVSFRAAGLKATDRILVGAALDRVFIAGLAYFLGLRRLGATVIRAGSGQPALVAELIRRQRPNVLIGVPSLLLTLARQYRERGDDPAALGIEKVICIGEPVRKQTLELSPLGEALQQQWGAQILGTYASTEMATAFTDCTSACGGHVVPELVYVEIVDAEGNAVPHGCVGEVVATPLQNQATPLLRYRTGDMASMHIEPCLCGRLTPRLGPIVGRRAQMLKCRGTTLFPAAIDNALAGIEGVMGHYVEVRNDYDLCDRVRVVVGCRDSTLSAEFIAGRIGACTRVKPEVVLVSPLEIQRMILRPEKRKPVTFFDYRSDTTI